MPDNQDPKDNTLPFMNSSQISGGLDRAIIALLMWAAGKGYIPIDQVTPYATLLGGLAALLYGFYVNRNKALAQAAASLPNTTVITTPAIADSTPKQTNIVSNAENVVVETK